MISSLRKRLSFSNLISMTALFIALGGAAVAAGLPKRSVGPRQLKRGAVTRAAIRRGAVTSGKLAPRAVTPGKLGPNSVGPGNIGNGAVTSAKIASGAVIARSLKNGVVTTNKLHPGAVTGEKLAAGAVGTANIANGAVTLGKLGNEVGPLIGPLRSGQTLRGMLDLGAGKGGEESVIRSANSYQFPLANAPAANLIPAGGSATPACAGLAGGNQQTPEAAAGQLCVYLTNASSNLESVSFDPGSVSRLGFGLVAKFKEEAGVEENFVQGYWAVTAS